MQLNYGDIVEVVKRPDKSGEANSDIRVGDIASVCVSVEDCAYMGWSNTVGLDFGRRIYSGHDCGHYSGYSGSDDRICAAGCRDGYGWFISTDCLRLISGADEDNFEFDMDDIKKLMQ